MFKFWQLNKSIRVERFLKGLNENNKELEKILDYNFKIKNFISIVGS